MPSTDSVPVVQLLWTVFESIVEVFVPCLAGLLLARAGVTDKQTQKKINKLNISLFTPCLLFSRVAFTLTPAKLKELWIVPVGFVVVSGVSTLVAWALGTALKLKRSQRSFAMAGAMFMNSNSLPIALMQSLVIEVPGLKWGDDDDDEGMLGRALTYLVLYSTLGMMLRWSYGVHLLTQADDEAASNADDGDNVEDPHALEAQSHWTANDNQGAPLLRNTRDERSQSVASSTASGARTDPDDPWANVPHSYGEQAAVKPPAGTVLPSAAAGLAPPTRKNSGFHTFPNSPTSSHEQAPTLVDGENEEEFDGGTERDEDDEENETEDAEWGNLPNGHNPRRSSNATGSKWRSFWRRRSIKARKVLKTINEFMTIPMYSAFASIFIAMIPPLQHQLSRARPIRAAIHSAGSCSIPLTLIVLGAYFYTPSANDGTAPTMITQPARPRSWYRPFGRKEKLVPLPQKKMARPGENRTVFVAIMSRMIITPLILLPVIAICANYDYFEAAEDPVFILTAVLIVASPPAITLAQITQAASGDAFERLISKTIWISYGVLTPPLTLLYVVLGLILSRL